MWNPPLIFLSAFHWLSENSKQWVFFMHYLSTLKCKHCSLFKIYVGSFKQIYSLKYPGYTLEFEIPRVLLEMRQNWAITQGNPGLPWVFSLMLVEYKNNLPKYTLGFENPGLPWVIICDHFNGGFHRWTLTAKKGHRESWLHIREYPRLCQIWYMYSCKCTYLL